VSVLVPVSVLVAGVCAVPVSVLVPVPVLCLCLCGAWFDPVPEFVPVPEFCAGAGAITLPAPLLTM